MSTNSNQKRTSFHTTITLPVFSDRMRRLTILGLCIISLLLIFSLINVPFNKISYVDVSGDTVEITVKGANIINLTKDIIIADGQAFDTDFVAIGTVAVFVAIVIFGTVGAFMLLRVVRRYGASDERFFGSAQALTVYAVSVTGAFYVASMLFSCTQNMRDDFPFTYGHCFCPPLLISVCIAIIFVFLTRNITPADEARKPKKTAVGVRIEQFIYASAVTLLAIFAALGDILTVKPSFNASEMYFNGLEALKGTAEVPGSMQILTFFVVVFVAANCAFILTSLCALIGRSKAFWQLSLLQTVVGTVTTFVIGVFGLYFSIAKDINKDIMTAWILRVLADFDHGYWEQFFDPEKFQFTYEVESSVFWFFIAAVGVLCLMLLRKPYSRGTKNELTVSLSGASAVYDASRISEPMPDESTAPLRPGDHDPCPAFSSIDAAYKSMRASLEAKQANSFENPTLGEIVDFVVKYARDSRLHLIYSPEDVAAFIAGLGACRLTILQGMSGTGKTSLPKIFAEAILGECNIVEVESAWRDKNELLGYYNEFSSIYTPKKFTLALYRARLMPEVPTFIVLDEMNLSRIEYYFSDFLSIMENEEGQREIRLLGTPLYRRRDGSRYRYIGLKDGTTVNIPQNVWFVGTANRDESTFEISDKVYDRAHTMNFNKRAPKVRSYGEPMKQKYVSAAALCELFEAAKASVYFDIDAAPVVGKVEALLAPYNISFGNRVAGQMEDFVRIYAACFGATDRAIAEGLERILLSKVVAKLEFKSVVDKEELAASFEKLGLCRCSDFILSLNDD